MKILAIYTDTDTGKAKFGEVTLEDPTGFADANTKFGHCQVVGENDENESPAPSGFGQLVRVVHGSFTIMIEKRADAKDYQVVVEAVDFGVQVTFDEGDSGEFSRELTEDQWYFDLRKVPSEDDDSRSSAIYTTMALGGDVVLHPFYLLAELNLSAPELGFSKESVLTH